MASGCSIMKDMNSLSEKTKHLLLAAAAPALLIGTVCALLHHLDSGLDAELYGSLYSLGVIALVLLLRKKNLPENLGLAQGSWQDCLQAAAMSFAYAAAIGIVPELLNAPSALLDAVSLPTSDLMSTSMLPFLAAQLLILPLAQELCLRVLCTDHLRQVWTAEPVLLISALLSALYGSLRAGLYGALLAFLLGFLYALLYEKSESAWTVLCAHAGGTLGILSAYPAQVLDRWLLITLAVFLFATAVFLILHRLNRTEEDNPQ